jgi:HTH-type transcriptional regulator/antitoxin HigA
MKIHPIKSERDYESAIAGVERLWGAIEGSEKGDSLDILLVLIEDYENKHYPIDPPDPIEAIKFRMEQMNLSRAELEGIIGSRGRVSEVLNRRRGLSLNMIRSLHSNLHIPLESLIAKTKQMTD